VWFLFLLPRVLGTSPVLALFFVVLFVAVFVGSFLEFGFCLLATVEY